jgi:hypothetical protein
MAQGLNERVKSFSHPPPHILLVKLAAEILYFRETANVMGIDDGDTKRGVS